jgi:release factor glutamine methyltransferase
MTDDGGAGHTVSWRELCAETADRLAAAGIASATQEARWILQEVSGLEGAEWALGMDEPATQRGVARLDAMVASRLGGEPVQYVLGRWSFRTLDLLCDQRALIPRPETEQVVEAALRALDAVAAERPVDHRATVVDLGTGTGAIALSIAVERPGTEVWGVERSLDALAVARANLAGLGMAGMRVRLAEGSWFDPLPAELAGHLDMVVTNPPYVATLDELPSSVRDWEPADALVPAGDTGLSAYEAIVEGSARWLAPGGAFVAEVGIGQAEAVLDLLARGGFVDGRAEPDLAGVDRAVVARKST